MQNDFKPSKRPVKNAEICSICRIIIQKAADKRLVIIIILYVLEPYSVSVNSCSRLSQGFKLKKYEI